MEPNLWSETSVWVQLVYNVLLIVIPTLVGLVVLSESGRLFVSRIRALYKTVRPAIDEPTDPAIVYLARLTGKTEKEISAFLVGEGDKIVALLPKEAIPPVEVTPQVETFTA